MQICHFGKWALELRKVGKSDKKVAFPWCKAKAMSEKLIKFIAKPHHPVVAPSGPSKAKVISEK